MTYVTYGEVRLFDTPSARNIIYNYVKPDTIEIDVEDENPAIDTTFFEDYEADDPAIDDDVEYLDGFRLVDSDPLFMSMPRYLFRPVVFDTFHLLDSIPLYDEATGGEPFRWIEEDALHDALITQARQRYIIDYPQLVRYNEAFLPEPPKHYVATVDPQTAMIAFDVVNSGAAPIKDADVVVVFQKRHWLRKFNASLQFSQAYVSPNWYQGGNNNLNGILNLYYNVKLNQKFHPNLLFETTMQYKLGVNSTPEDSIRSYSLSEDLFQFNLMAGYKATRGWYYSTNISFKTQIFNNYKSNTRTMQAAFLSPAELNVGLGMTYNHTNPSKTFTIDSSISPLSWNLKTCINPHLDETAYGIKPGNNAVSEIGSNAEVKLSWKLASNINLRSRFFVFTDYEYVMGDWENTFEFNINRFLSTQIYVHTRYDSSTPRLADSRWHKMQLKEILSFGFSYSFSSI
ncbi:MAG: DUF3078 domain-containing protein [Lachnoclostridium sp.]|nr:DUF3078 domain-containing protein [Lachnoclostridium sp.]